MQINLWECAAENIVRCYVPIRSHVHGRRLRLSRLRKTNEQTEGNWLRGEFEWFASCSWRVRIWMPPSKRIFHTYLYTRTHTHAHARTHECTHEHRGCCGCCTRQSRPAIRAPKLIHIGYKNYTLNNKLFLSRTALHSALDFSFSFVVAAFVFREKATEVCCRLLLFIYFCFFFMTLSSYVGESWGWVVDEEWERIPLYNTMNSANRAEGRPWHTHHTSPIAVEQKIRQFEMSILVFIKARNDDEDKTHENKWNK